MITISGNFSGPKYKKPSLLLAEIICLSGVSLDSIEVDTGPFYQYVKFTVSGDDESMEKFKLKMLRITGY
jgi:hypothetical protein